MTTATSRSTQDFHVPRAIVLALYLSGCTAISENGTARSPVDAIAGRQVTIGYFEPAGDGYFATLKKVGANWQILSIALKKPENVSPDEELLFVGTSSPGAVEVTPVYGASTTISSGGSMLVCDPDKTEYSACHSAFAKSVPLLSDRRKLERDEIARAIRESKFFERLERAIPEIRRDESYRALANMAQVQDEQRRIRAQEEQQRAQGQAMIDRAEIGVVLCADLQVRDMPAVASAFLEGIQGDRIQLRINGVRSLDGRTTFTALRIEGIDYTPGNIVWSNRRGWRACE